MKEVRKNDTFRKTNRMLCIQVKITWNKIDPKVIDRINIFD
jgi:hypothetical protein